MDKRSKFEKLLAGFADSFVEAALKSGHAEEDALKTLKLFYKLCDIQFENPYQFEPHHKRVREPLDYHQFGIDFLSLLVDMKHSTVTGKEHFKQAEEQIAAGHNVVFFANHQIEADPIAITILLRDEFPKLSDAFTFVAGERVLTDPVAVPFSMGLNLLCIYSKKYIDNPPEDKHKKQLHNKRTMDLMSDLFKKGGLSIYVAPSGGRDRPGPSGDVEVAPFDPQSIEMFYLMAKKAKTPTHFYPLALATYTILPPPDTTQIELGEVRKTQGDAIHLACGAEIAMEEAPGSDEKDKTLRRQIRAKYIEDLVKKDYNNFPKG